MRKYKVKYYNRISISDYTLNQAKERVEFLNSTFKGCNAQIIEVKEKEKMKKNELKNDMIVELRNGDKRLVVDNNLFGNNGFDHLSNYDDDLKNKEFSVLDIIKVYKYKFPRSFYSILDYDNLNLIWERKDIELSDREIEVLKALKALGYEFLARDDNGKLFAYDKKPKKDGDDWVNDTYHFFIKDIKLFNFIKREDKEPTNIDRLLKEIKK